MLHISNSQRKTITKLSGGRHGKWTAENAIKAIKVIYGNKASFIKFTEHFHGNNTKTLMKCNLCGKTRHTTLRSILYHPTCPRCHFKGDCSRLSYSIIQQRLITKHRPIVIIPFYNQPYKNNSTKFMAYDYKHHESWITCASRLSEGKGAPNYKHKMGYRKEREPLSYYKKRIKSLYDGKVHIALAEKYHGYTTKVHVSNDVNDLKYTCKLSNLVNSYKSLSKILKNKPLSYYQKLIHKRFHNKLKITHRSDFIGKYTHIRGIDLLTHSRFNTTYGNLLLNTNHALLSDKQISIIKYFDNKYGKQNKNIESRISRANFGYAYNHQNDIYIPKIDYVMKHYSTSLKFRAFGLKDNFGHNHPWYTNSGNICSNNWHTPLSNIKERNQKDLNTGLFSFINWYKHQSRIIIPKFKRVLKRYYGNKMRVHCICTKCGYGKYGEWTETINKLLSGVRCPDCQHEISHTVYYIKHKINHLFHGHVSFHTIHSSKPTALLYNKSYVIASNDKGYTWTANVDSLEHGFVYLNQSISKGETAIGNALIKLGFIKQDNNKQLPTNNHFVHGYIFRHCHYKGHLHADFIVNVNHHYIVIEYDGYQHFAIVPYMGGKHMLIIRRHRDNLKNNYCMNRNNLTLMRIGDYWNLNTMHKIKHLVKICMRNEFMVLVHLYSHHTNQQLSLF